MDVGAAIGVGPRCAAALLTMVPAADGNGAHTTPPAAAAALDAVRT